MNIALAILHLHPTADSTKDFRVEDDGSGPQLVHWDLTEPQPTEEQLETAWQAVQVEQAAKDALWNARVAMANAWASLPADVRADHAHDYASIEASLIRGDVEAAKLRIQRVTLLPEREPLRAQFLALFPE